MIVFKGRKPMHRNYLYLIILPLFLFLPRISYASGMEGLGIIILMFILIIAPVPGALIKLLFQLPSKNRSIFVRTVFIIMLVEATLILISAIVWIMFLPRPSPLTFVYIPPYFVAPIYFVPSICANLFLFRGPDKKYFGIIINLENILKASFFSLITPIGLALFTFIVVL